MKIISIDVGMKHLAYCIFFVKDAVCEVDAWGVINLTGKGPMKCLGITGSNKPCTRLARYRKNEEYYCKLHAKNRQYKIPPREFRRIRKCTVRELKVLGNELCDDLPKKINKADLVGLLEKHIASAYFDTIENKSARSIDLTTYGRQLKIQFDELLADTVIDCAIIENQIGPIALRMKVLQGMITQHFIEMNCPIIEKISPSCKLKEFLGENKKTTYGERKKLGIEVTKQHLKDIPSMHKWESYFYGHKKKDDLADAFLQGMWYLKSTGSIKSG